MLDVTISKASTRGSIKIWLLTGCLFHNVDLHPLQVHLNFVQKCWDGA